MLEGVCLLVFLIHSWCRLLSLPYETGKNTTTQIQIQTQQQNHQRFKDSLGLARRSLARLGFGSFSLPSFLAHLQHNFHNVGVGQLIVISELFWDRGLLLSIPFHQNGHYYCLLTSGGTLPFPLQPLQIQRPERAQTGRQACVAEYVGSCERRGFETLPLSF